MGSRMKTAFKFAIAIAILGAVIAAASLTSYLVRYSQHDAKYGLIPDDEYFELTSITEIERSFFKAGSISFLIAAVVAIIILVRIRSRRQ